MKIQLENSKFTLNTSIIILNTRIQSWFADKISSFFIQQEYLS